MKKRFFPVLYVFAMLLGTWACKDDENPKSNISLHVDSVALFVDEDSSLQVTVTPTNATIEWSSDNTAVATVDDNGEVTAIAPGLAIITATAKDKSLSATCTIAVQNGYHYNNTRIEIKTAVYGNYAGGGGADGGYQFWFFPTVESDGVFDGANEYIWIDIPQERMGTTFPLTEDNPYDWGWWIQYSDADSDVNYEGFGASGSLENVVSGTMYAEITGTDSFKVTFTVVLDDGKVLKGVYVGTLVENSSYYG